MYICMYFIHMNISVYMADRRVSRAPVHNGHPLPLREREIFIDNLLVRVRSIIEMSRPALRRGSLNSLFQVALCLPS